VEYKLLESWRCSGNIQRKVSTWEHDEFGSVRKELHHLRQKLEEEQRRNVFSGPSQEEHRVMNRLAELLAREEIMEKQRLRIDWLKVGDRNTGFFSRESKTTIMHKQNRSLKMR
jgi:hypothetical protein